MRLLACCLLPVACLPFASCVLPIANCLLACCNLPACLLPIAYCLVCCLVCITFFLSSPAQHTVTHTQIKLLQTCPTWQAVNTSCLHISRSNGKESTPKHMLSPRMLNTPRHYNKECKPMTATQNTNTIGPNPQRRQHSTPNKTLHIENCLARVTVLYIIWSLPCCYCT